MCCETMIEINSAVGSLLLFLMRFSFIKSFTLLEKMFSIVSAILATPIKARIMKPCGVSFVCRAGADLFALHTLDYYTFGELSSEI